MRLKLATTSVIGRGTTKYATEMSNILARLGIILDISVTQLVVLWPITPVVAGSTLIHALIIIFFIKKIT